MLMTSEQRRTLAGTLTGLGLTVALVAGVIIAWLLTHPNPAIKSAAVEYSLLIGVIAGLIALVLIAAGRLVRSRGE